jgi:hypothetical protein
MAYTRRILCLAASRKHGGHCYAGKDVETGDWIRPVSARDGQEISDRERTLFDGTEAKVLDILEISFQRPAPDGYQSENHLISSSKRWKKVGEADWADVENALDDHDGPLWVNEGHSWGFFRNRVRELALEALDHSLVLIRPSMLQLVVGPKGGSFGDPDERRVIATFRHDGVAYTLQVTDPSIERRFLEGRDRIEDMTGAVLCVSLGEVHRGHAYKLVAAVIEPPEEG